MWNVLGAGWRAALAEPLAPHLPPRLSLAGSGMPMLPPQLTALAALVELYLEGNSLHRSGEEGLAPLQHLEAFKHLCIQP